LPDAFDDRNSTQFLWSLARKVTECPALGGAVEQSLFLEAIERRHDGRVSLRDLLIFEQFTNRGGAARPEGLQHLLFERP
jgi:hypothetical protein